MANDETKTPCSYNWEAKCRDLQAKNAELEARVVCLTEEKAKLGIQYEKLLKEKSDLERQIGKLEGMVEAYQLCAYIRR